MNIFRKYWLQIIESASALAMPAVGIWLGTWWRNISTAEVETSVVMLLRASALDLSTPLPYFAAAGIGLFAGKLEGFRNRDKAASLILVEKQLREETQLHAESKSSYLGTLKDVLSYQLTARTIGFSQHCRVTIYRLEDSADCNFRQIFRHSPYRAYSENGRLRIPINEGVVGAAWNNHGEKEFECDDDPTSEAFQAALSQAIHEEGCICPPNSGSLSMPSRHYFAAAFKDYESGKAGGIVVYECTNVSDLNVSAIRDMLREESLNMSRFIRLLVILDRDFNPDMKGA